MRKIQKVIIIIYCMVVAVACTYVPWISKLPSPNSNISVSLGYSPIWKSLTLTKNFTGNNKVPNLSSVDIKRVILELIAITAVFAIFFVLTLRPKDSQQLRKSLSQLL